MGQKYTPNRSKVSNTYWSSNRIAQVEADKAKAARVKTKPHPGEPTDQQVAYIRALKVLCYMNGIQPPRDSGAYSNKYRASTYLTQLLSMTKDCPNRDQILGEFMKGLGGQRTTKED